MQLTTNRLVEVAIKTWEELDKKDRELLLKWDQQVNMLEKFIEGFITGYATELEGRLTEEDIKNLYKYKKEAIKIIEAMDLTL